MILVDTSVWIDFFSSTGGLHGEELRRLLDAEEDLALADLILMEVLQGIRDDRMHSEIQSFLLDFPIYPAGGLSLCLKSAELYRKCRKRGVTIRRSIDCLLAVTAIENGLKVFHKDRDFDLIRKAAPLQIYEF